MLDIPVTFREALLIAISYMLGGFSFWFMTYLTFLTFGPRRRR
jgi:hypothetical protein